MQKEPNTFHGEGPDLIHQVSALETTLLRWESDLAIGQVQQLPAVSFNASWLPEIQILNSESLANTEMGTRPQTV